MCEEARWCGWVDVGGELVVPPTWAAVSGLDGIMAYALALKTESPNPKYPSLNAHTILTISLL